MFSDDLAVVSCEGSQQLGEESCFSPRILRRSVSSVEVGHGRAAKAAGRIFTSRLSTHILTIYSSYSTKTY